MQSHLDNTGRNSSSSNSFSAMLSSDPFGGPPSHDFTTLTSNSHNNGTEFGHLLSSNNNHQQQQHHHHQHHHHSHHNTNNNNNNNNNNHNPSGGSPITADSVNTSTTNSTLKPKKPPPPNGKKTKGRVKIKMEFIDNKLRRYTTFSKRKTGIMKKAYELSTLTGTQVMLLVASETGHVYTFATRKLQPMITSEAGKALIQTCLNSPDPPNSVSDTQRMSATGYEETELTYAADPNASDHGDIKDDESESGGSSEGDDQKDGTPLLPLNNGLLPPNFAALFASASAAGLSGNSKQGGGLSIGLISPNDIRSSSTTNRSSSSHHHHHPDSCSTSSSSTSTITITPTSSSSSSSSSSNTTTSSILSRIKSEVLK